MLLAEVSPDPARSLLRCLGRDVNVAACNVGAGLGEGGADVVLELGAFDAPLAAVIVSRSRGMTNTRIGTGIQVPRWPRYGRRHGDIDYT